MPFKVGDVVENISNNTLYQTLPDGTGFQIPPGFKGKITSIKNGIYLRLDGAISGSYYEDFKLARRELTFKEMCE